MWAKPVLLGALCCLAFVQTATEEKAKKDLQAMQGKWMMHALEINGKAVPPAQIADTFLDVKGDVYRTTVKKKEPPGMRIKLDASKDPCEIDMILNDGGVEKIYKGIYTVADDQLKICRAATPENARPTQFATWPDTNYFVVTWKKVAK